MTHVLPEDRAWRRTFVAGVLGPCLGFVVTDPIAGIVALPWRA